jgi:hypothetical protein
MFVSAANISDVSAPVGASPFMAGPHCKARDCFIGSYPPVTPAGHMGPFFVNTYFLQSDRIQEVGPVKVHRP